MKSVVGLIEESIGSVNSPFSPIHSILVQHQRMRINGFQQLT